LVCAQQGVAVLIISEFPHRSRQSSYHTQFILTAGFHAPTTTLLHLARSSRDCDHPQLVDYADHKTARVGQGGLIQWYAKGEMRDNSEGWPDLKVARDRSIRPRRTHPVDAEMACPLSTVLCLPGSGELPSPAGPTHEARGEDVGVGTTGSVSQCRRYRGRGDRGTDDENRYVPWCIYCHFPRSRCSAREDEGSAGN
jgi:hypothetical protein